MPVNLFKGSVGLATVVGLLLALSVPCCVKAARQRNNSDSSYSSSTNQNSHWWDRSGYYNEDEWTDSRQWFNDDNYSYAPHAYRQIWNRSPQQEFGYYEYDYIPN